ncbi:hypothetical protein GLW03_12635 [Halobacillus halophilus]|uniref:hypothetical protein n=1 Tax=Halobacillus TaxID=45667 RepID=UPI001369DD0F|nr:MULTISPECIES: hypothetical protein [Halobacillus]MCA1022636.1 hypothetical protein [Halobacillus litoralis]MYL30672.1 hypothetical protein [Halobacillus halophilus]
MSEKQQLYAHTGLMAAFSLFLFLSFVTAEADSAQRVMITISEVIGCSAVAGAAISLYYIKSSQRMLILAILAFLAPWLVYGIGYEAGWNGDTSYVWVWFIGLYLLLTGSFIVLRMSYKKTEEIFKLVPVFLMFVNAILTAYLIFIHIWWSLPFV